MAGQNAAENNYLSDAQAAQEQKELKQCTNIGCIAKVKTQWAAINVAQQASFTAGIAVGLPAGAIEPIQELVQMATNPGETYEALKGLFTSGNILGNVSDAVKESYISRLDKLEEEYQRAGASGSYNAGIETGKLLLDMAALATGAGGAAKAGIKVTEKAVAKVANAAKKEVIEAGKAAEKGANIANGTSYLNNININELKFTKTVENHLNDLNKAGDKVRPYGDSKALIQEIMNSQNPVTDPRGVPGALRWDVKGTMNGSKGKYELVIDPKTNTVLHFLFKSEK